MNFDSHQDEWKKFIQIKSNLATALKSEENCSVCVCLELLKLVTCNGNCYGSSWNQTFDRILQGVLEAEPIRSIRSLLETHTEQIALTISFRTQLEELQKLLHNIKDNQIESPPTSTGLEPLIEKLQERLSHYEQSLSSLQNQNEQLRQQLRRTSILYQEYINTGHKSRDQVLDQIRTIKEEQSRLKINLEVISKQVSENTVSIRKIQKDREELVLSEVETGLSELRKEKNQLLKEQEATIRKNLNEIDVQNNKILETEQVLKFQTKEIDRLLEVQSEVKKEQQECKELSRHSSHLLTAADSVFSAQHQLQQFQTLISQRLSEFSAEIESLKAQKQPKKQTQEKGHPGILQFDPAAGDILWSCCKEKRYAEGCIENN